MSEESLFVAALERPAGSERDAFLADACAGDHALRKRVERLLSAHEQTLGILDRSIEQTGSSSPESNPELELIPEGEWTDTVLAGRYRLIDEVGSGGMGTVWKAEQTEPVRRIVAVKLIRAWMNSRTVLARFESERQALALMDHPNIAKVLDGGNTDAGRPFFVMEYVDGVPITQYCDDKRLNVTERLELFMTVCRAVQHAHSKGVIHRDLKPGNILVCQTDGHATPKVIDFGLAKAIQEPLIEHMPKTADGAMLGTPLYMSPEQAVVDNIDIDVRADVYALGVILYELLTGTTPLERARLRDAPWHQMLWLIKEEEPPRPSARLSAIDSLPSVAAQRHSDPSRLAREVRGELDWIVMKCLEKDRTRRYETASGLARDIQRYLADESVEACPPSVSYRFKKFVRRNRGAVVAVTVCFLALIWGIAGTTLGMMRARRAQAAEGVRANSERLAKDVAEKRLHQVEQGLSFLETVFKDLDPRVEDKEGKNLRQVLGERIAQRANEVDDQALGDPIIVAETQYRLGLSLLQLGLPKKAIPIFQKVRNTRIAELGPGAPETLSSSNALAEAYEQSGDLDSAMPLFEETLKARQETLGTVDPDTIYSMHNLATALKSQDKLDKALPLLEEALRLERQSMAPDAALTLMTMNSLAVSYVADKKLDKAGPLLEETLKLRKAKLKEEHPDTLSSMNSLGDFYNKTNRRDEAIKLLSRTLELRKVKLSPDHPDTLTTMNNLAVAYMDNGETEKAIPLLEDSLKASKVRRGLDNPYTLGSMSNLAWVYRSVNRMDDAIALFREAATIIEQRRFRDEFADAIVSNLAVTLERQKRFKEAEAWRKKWVAAVKEKAGADSRRYAGEMGLLGSNLRKQKRWREAESTFREVLGILQKQAPDSLARVNVQSELGNTLLNQKKYEQAEPLLVAGYEGLKAREAQIEPEDKHRIIESGQDIVQLYEAWGKEDKAAEWRAKLPKPAEDKPQK